MKKYIALLLVLALLSGCHGPAASAPQKAEKTVYAMDTVMTLTAYGENGAAGLDRAEAEILRLDDLLSISKETSDVYKLNRDKTGDVSPETGQLLERALDIAELTEGDFDPTIYAAMRDWGFYSNSGHGYRVPPLAQAARQIDYRNIHAGEITAGENTGRYWVTVNYPSVGLDLGGIAKGYTSERALEVMEDSGVTSAIVSLGGNVGTLGRKPDGSAWNVAIQDPEQESGYIATLSLGEAEGCVYAITSGGYQRYFEEDGKRYHHILDPKTGAPAETDLLSVTIVSEDGTLADGLSTALFVKGFEEAVEFWRDNAGEFEMVLVTEKGLFATEGLDISSERPINILEVAP